MGGRRRDGGERPSSPRLNAPFAELRSRLVERRPARVMVAVPVDKPVRDEADVFASAMEGVVRLHHGPGGRVEGPRPAGAGRPPVDEEAEALAALSDLVEGDTHFDLTDTREYVEGAIVGLDPRVLRRLRRGVYAWQAYLDLHGMTAEKARAAVDQFLAAAVLDGYRCVLIVHGRGRNSKDRTPVLKERLKS